MNIDEIILKCQIGEEHLDQAEYEQVARWLEEYKKLKAKKEFCMGHVNVRVTDSDEFIEVVKAFKMACEYLWDNSICECCPKLPEREKCGCEYCDITSNEIGSYMLKKARELSEGS